MKALVLNANAEVAVCTVPDPCIQEDECLLKVEAVGVCSSDIARCYQQGAYRYPLIIGHEFAGRIVAVGQKAKPQFSTGDAVTVFPLVPCQKCSACAEQNYHLCRDYTYYGSRRDGAMAEYIAVKSWNLIKLPSNVDLESAALLEPLAVSLHAVKRLQLLSATKAKKNLLIIGGGFLGILAQRIVAYFQPNIHVTLIDRNEDKLNRADLRKYSNLELKLLRDENSWQDFLTHHESRYAAVLECCGDPKVFSRALHLAAPRGSIGFMGNPTGDVTISKTQVSGILRKELNIVGVWNSIFHPQGASDWHEAIDLLLQGFPIRDLISHEVCLDELPFILAKMRSHKNRQENFSTLKVLVHPHRTPSNEV